MSGSTNRRGSSTLLALALAGGTLMAAASPAHAAVPEGTYAGAAEGQGILIAGGDPEAPEDERDSLALTEASGNSTALRNGTSIDPQSALAYAGFLGGTPAEDPDPCDPEGSEAVATLEDPGPCEVSGGEAPEDSPLQITGGNFFAVVDPEPGDTASIAEPLDVATAPLGDIFPPELVDPIEEGLGQLTDALANELLTPILEPIDEGADTELIQLARFVEDLEERLFRSPLLAFEDIEQIHEVLQEEDGVSAFATSTLGSISVLDGLAELAGPDDEDLAQTFAETFAGGVPGSGTAEAEASFAEVTAIDDLFSLVVGEDPILDAEFGAIPGDLNDAVLTEIEDGVDQLATALLEGLGEAGIRLEPGAEDTFVDPDGTRSTAAAAGLLISVTPPESEGEDTEGEDTEGEDTEGEDTEGEENPLDSLGAAASEGRAITTAQEDTDNGDDEEVATPLLEIAIGSARAVSQVTLMADAPPPPPAGQPAPVQAAPTLPRTGGELPLALGGGIALVSLAVLRRRRAQVDTSA
jgi:hypothetical protein